MKATTARRLERLEQHQGQTAPLIVAVEEPDGLRAMFPGLGQAELLAAELRKPAAERNIVTVRYIDP